MSVYVDDMGLAAEVGRVKGRWSHLMADTPEELMSFATGVLRFRPDWLQYPGTPMEHFDVVETKRKAALAAGAVPITWREGAGLTQAKLLGVPFDLYGLRAEEVGTQFELPI